MKKVIILLLIATLLITVFVPGAPVAYAASNEQIIYEYLVNTVGLNTAAACGVLANIEKESDFNPNLYGDSGTSYGICQWHNERWTELKNYCNDHGYSWESLTGQLHFLEYELKNKSRFALVWSTLTSVPNTAQGCYDAAYRWCYSFEVPHYYNSPYQGYNSESEYRAYYAKNTYWPKYQYAASSGYLSSCTQYPSYCIVKVTNSSAPIWTLPCSSTTDASSKKIETANSGSSYTSTRLILNDQGNYWYRVIAKTGETGYLFAGNCSYQSSITDLDISNATAPPTLTHNSTWAITGTISTTYNELTSVTAKVYPGTNTTGNSETGDTVTASGQSYSLPGSALDTAVHFETLESGKHTYVISASAICYYATSALQLTSTTISKTLFSSGFYIKGEETSANNYQPVGQVSIFEGGEEYIRLEGWTYDEDYENFALTVYITIDGTKYPYVLTADRYNSDVPIGYKYKGFSGYLQPGITGDHVISVYATNVDIYGNNSNDDTLIATKTLTILPKHVHQYEVFVIEPTCTEQGYTLHQCNCGDHYEDSYTDMIDHEYTGVRIDTEPTLSTGGELTWFCCNCSHIDEQNIPSLSTLGAYQKEVVSTATCTQKGLTRYYLLNVRNSDLQSFIYFDVEEEAFGHNYQSTVVPPTCTEQGYTERVCTVCGDSSIEDIVVPLGHNYDSTVIPPTCTEQGYTERVCTVCSDSSIDDIVAPLGHNYETTVVSPTCTEQGYTERVCVVCGESYRENTVAPLGHEYINGVCIRCGEANSTVKKGDLNGDGDITSADAVMLARYLADLIDLTERQRLAADLNGDGEITSADAVRMARYLAGLIESLD